MYPVLDGVAVEHHGVVFRRERGTVDREDAPVSVGDGDVAGSDAPPVAVVWDPLQHGGPGIAAPYSACGFEAVTNFGVALIDEPTSKRRLMDQKTVVVAPGRLTVADACVAGLACKAERGEDVDDVIAKIQASRRAVKMVNQSRIVDHKRRKEAVLTWMETLYVPAGVQRWARRHGSRNCRCSCRLPSLTSSRRRR